MADDDAWIDPETLPGSRKRHLHCPQARLHDVDTVPLLRIVGQRVDQGPPGGVEDRLLAFEYGRSERRRGRQEISPHTEPLRSLPGEDEDNSTRNAWEPFRWIVQDCAQRLADLAVGLAHYRGARNVMCAAHGRRVADICQGDIGTRATRTEVSEVEANGVAQCFFGAGGQGQQVGVAGLDA
ncbi:hypothetical protein RhoFasSB10_04459 [Rhodococcus fascians]|nr:hypothetical protein [Rhodococcus fascians]